MTDYDVLIAGAGLVGSATAISLSRLGLRVALVEPSGSTVSAQPERLTTECFDNRVFAIRPSTKRFLTDEQLWNNISEKRVQRVTRMHIDGEGRERLTLGAHDAGIVELACIVENDNLWRSICSRLDDSVARLHGDILAIDQEPGLVTVVTSKRKVNCKLLVAADGANSVVRRHCEISVGERDYNYTGLVANFTVARPHRGAAYQWMGAEGVIAYLPLPGNLVSIVWSAQDEFVRGLDDDFLFEELSKRYNPLGIVDLVSRIGRFPLRRVLPQTVTSGRVVLIGDAAHQFLPLAGQGLNVGLADTAKLTGLVKQYGLEDPGRLAVVNRYRRARKEEIEIFTYFTEVMHDMAVRGSDCYRTLHNIGVGAVRHADVLKRVLIKKAVG
ncbi:MAG: hypothetical protein HOK08_06385 [Betaproteobacteria bacterium]|nr:hypothetical protein [Betaproteobacteria bacterium]